MDVLGQGFAIMWGLIGLAITTWLVAMTSRRVLGIQVGLMRALLVTFVAMQAATAAISYAFGQQIVPRNSYHGIVTAIFIVLALLGSFALGVLFLMVLEVIVPTGMLPPLRSMLTGWRARFHLGRRYLTIMSVLAKHGLAVQLRGVGGRTSVHSTAASLRQALSEAGVTFVKLGQMLSTRADLLPPVFIVELSKLTTHAQPVAFEQIEAVLRDELGTGLDRLEVCPDPLASASVAQVHSAVLDGKREVVVKVQRPGAAEQVNLDLRILTSLARTLERNAPWAARLDVVDLVNGFAASLRDEMDYRIEVATMRALRVSLSDSGIRVPEVDDLSTTRVITMERFDGVPVSEAADLIASLDADTRHRACHMLLAAVMNQILGDGIFHADLHSGNVLVWPDGSIGLLDYGSVGRLDARSRRYLGLLLHAVDSDDPALATDAVLELLDHSAKIDERRLQREIGQVITRFRNGLAGGSKALFQQILGIVLAHGMSVPVSVASALRSLGALEGTLKLLEPDLDIVVTARELAADATGHMSVSDLATEAKNHAVRLLPLIENLPRRANSIIEDIEQGRLAAHIRVIAHPDDRAFITGLVNHIVIAVLAGFAVVAAVLLATSNSGPVLFDTIRLFDLLSYLLAFAGLILALRSVAMVFGHRRSS